MPQYILCQLSHIYFKTPKIALLNSFVPYLYDKVARIMYNGLPVRKLSYVYL